MYKIVYNKETVGFIELYDDEKDKEVAYIAYSVHPKYWNRGIGTIAVKKILLKFTDSLKKLKIKYIRATVRITNIGSITILTKNGFQIIDEKFFAECPIKVLQLNI